MMTIAVERNNLHKSRKYFSFCEYPFKTKTKHCPPYILCLVLIYFCVLCCCDSNERIYSSCLEIFEQQDPSSNVTQTSAFIQLKDGSVIEVDCVKLNDSLANDGQLEVHTVVHHDSEDTKPVQGFESPGSFRRMVRYKNINRMEQLEYLIN